MTTHQERSICHKATHLTECHRDHFTLSSRGPSINTHCYHSPGLWPLQFSLQCFPHSVHSSSHKGPCSPSFLLSVSLYLLFFLLFSHPVDTPTSKMIQVSTTMVSSAKNIICVKGRDEHSERTDRLSSHMKRKITEISNRISDISWFSLARRHLLAGKKKVYFKTIKYDSVL